MEAAEGVETPTAAFCFLEVVMRPRVVVGAVLLMALCHGWGKGNGDEWERLVLDGAAHESAGNYVAAAASFRDAVRIAEQPIAPECDCPYL